MRRRHETQHDPVGLLGTKSLANSCYSRNRDAETWQEQPRNKSAASEQGPGPSSRDTHNNIFELFTELKAPTNGRC